MAGYGTRYLIGMLLVLLPMAAGTVYATSDPVLSENEKLEVIDQRLQFYKKSFPEIAFVHAIGGERWQDDFVGLRTLIGNNAVNLDYQHAPELATDLMEVTLRRLATMLEHNVVSESLIRSDPESPMKGMPVCIITLNPNAYADDNLKTTAYMIDLPDVLMAKVHPSRLLDARDHLRFTIDHEVYHCLDSRFNGGAPVTMKEFGGDYNLFRRESGADAFALAMHLGRDDASPRYIQNIMLMRALWLYTEGPNRCTFESMLEIYQQPASAFSGKPAIEIFRIASDVRDAKSGSYDFHVGRLAAKLEAARQLGYEPSIYGNHWIALENIETDPRRVSYKAARYKYYFGRLFDDAAIEFLPADPEKRE